jgi:hypothetical protein
LEKSEKAKSSRMARTLDLVLTGCGAAAVHWIGHLMVLRAAESVEIGSVYAASSGALVGAVALCDVDPAVCLAALRGMRGKRWLACAMREAMHALLPPDAHALCSGRLHVRTTRAGVPPRSVCTSQYASRAELLDVLYATTIIPFVTAPALGHALADGFTHADGVVAPTPARRAGVELLSLPVLASLASTELPTPEEIDVAVVRGVHAMCAMLKIDLPQIDLGLSIKRA